MNSFGFLHADIDSDAKNIISAGLGECDGIINIMGTGSSCFVKIGDGLDRVGGYGYLFDQGGSAYDVGRAAVTLTSRHEDSRESGSIIPDIVYRELGAKSLNECLGRVYASGKRGIAALAPVVFEAYDKGDEKAREILEIILDKYSDNGIIDIENADILKVDPISGYGTQLHIVNSIFGGMKNYINAIRTLENAIYAVAA